MSVGDTVSFRAHWLITYCCFVSNTVFGSVDIGHKWAAISKQFALLHTQPTWGLCFVPLGTRVYRSNVGNTWAHKRAICGVRTVDEANGICPVQIVGDRSMCTETSALPPSLQLELSLFEATIWKLRSPRLDSLHLSGALVKTAQRPNLRGCD